MCVCEVLPIHKLLRAAWDGKKFGSKDDDKVQRKPFLVQETALATIKSLNALMASDFDWATVHVICALTAEADAIGKWAEDCPCHSSLAAERALVAAAPRTRKRARQSRGPERIAAASCCLRGCRAPELATGAAMTLQSRLMRYQRGEIMDAVAKAPDNQKNDILSTWNAGRAKLWGILIATYEHFSTVILL